MVSVNVFKTLTCMISTYSILPKTIAQTPPGESVWIGDGFCDDMNNNIDCAFDDGDCCGGSVRTPFCVDCICWSK